MNTITDIIYGPALGLTRKEIDAWSWPEFLQLASRGAAQRLGFYRSVSDAAFAQRGRPPSDPRAFAIPADIMARDPGTPATDRRLFGPSGVQQRDLTATTSTAGGHLVGTDIVSRQSSLLSRNLVGSLPIQRVGGLRGDATIPTSAGATTSWLSTEAATVPDGDPAFDQIALTPKNLAAFVEISRQLSLQAGPAGGQFITGELEIALGRALDLALLAGTGAGGQPLSPFKAPGVGSTSGTSLNWGGICALTVSAEAVQLGQPSWILGANCASVLRQRERSSGSGSYIFDRGEIAGYQAAASSAAPTGSLFLADWGQIILGTWGGIEVSVDPFTSFSVGRIGLRAWLACDFATVNTGALSFAESVT